MKWNGLLGRMVGGTLVGLVAREHTLRTEFFSHHYMLHVDYNIKEHI